MPIITYLFLKQILAIKCLFINRLILFYLYWEKINTSIYHVKQFLKFHDLYFFKDPGYGICWDNVQTLISARCQSTRRTNTIHLWALSYMYKNRIPTAHINDVSVTSEKDIELNCFLPDEQDLDLLRRRMQVIVQRILVKNFKYFKVLR